MLRIRYLKSAVSHNLVRLYHCVSTQPATVPATGAVVSRVTDDTLMPANQGNVRILTCSSGREGGGQVRCTVHRAGECTAEKEDGTLTNSIRG